MSGFMLAFVAIFALLVTWLGYALICVGWGAWFYRRSVHDRATAMGDFAATFWVGLATLLGALQIWHFFGAINFAAHCVLTIAGLISAAFLLRPLVQALRTIPPKTLRRAALALAVFAVWIADRAIGPGAYYDAGLYHIAAVKWTQAYPIVPGLANLHMRFGFASTLTLFSALLNHGAWGGFGNHLVNGFFLVACGAMIARSAAKVLRRGDTPASPQHWVLVFSAMLLMDWALDIQVSSYSTDLAVAVMTLVAAHYFLELFAVRTWPSHASAAAMVCVALLAATITAKASAIVLAGPMVAVAWLVLWRAGRTRALLPSAAFVAVLVGCWMGRQIILTGYPLYPSEAFALPVDWVVPSEKVAWLRRIILDFGRWQRYDDTRTHWNWLPIWWNKRMLDGWSLCKGVVPLFVAGMALVALIARIGRTFRMATAWRGVVWLQACVLLAMVAWWASAPDPRYATQVFALFMAGNLTLVLAVTKHRWAKHALLVAAALIAAIPLFLGPNAPGFYGARTIKDIWLLAPPSGMLYPTPTGDYTSIRAGTSPAAPDVFVPVPVPDESSEDRMWDGPLPGTPESEIHVKEVAIPELRWRKPGSLRDGFSRRP